MAKKRITELATETTLKDGQYVAIDHTTDGTKKYNIGAELTDLKEDLTTETTARETAVADLNAKVSTLSDATTLSTYNNDQVPYLFRPSGGGKFIGGIEKDTIVGGTVAWNQLCNGASVTVPSGHKYYMVKGGTASIGASTGTAITGLTSGTDIVSDLTQLFGSTIADYIYSLEQANAGAGVAWFKKLFPKDYYAYNEGELISISGLQSHDMVGFNQWDGTYEAGKWISNGATGETANASGYNVTGYIKIFPNTVYYHSATGSIRGTYFDADKNAIGACQWNADSTETMPSNAHYVRFTVTNANLSAFIINLSWDGERDGEYEPYIKHSYPLDDSLTLRGIPKLDASNQLYYDGDRYLPDGTVERRYGIVDLGTLSWSKSSSGNKFYANIPAYTMRTNMQMICAKYVWGGIGSQGDYCGEDKTIRANYTATAVPSSQMYEIYVHDEAYADATAFKTAMSGVYLVYELATPTTETADPYQNPQIVDKNGTEEYVTTGIVPVGHDTDYYLDADSVLTPPSTAGTYSLKVTVASDGSKSYSWVSD